MTDAGFPPGIPPRPALSNLRPPPPHMHGSMMGPPPQGFHPQFPQNGFPGRPGALPRLTSPFGQPQGPAQPVANNTTLPKPPIIDSEGQLWFEACSSEGKVYYFNAKTRETRWSKPDSEKVPSENKEKNDLQKEEAKDESKESLHQEQEDSKKDSKPEEEEEEEEAAQSNVSSSSESNKVKETPSLSQGTPSKEPEQIVTSQQGPPGMVSSQQGPPPQPPRMMSHHPPPFSFPPMMRLPPGMPPGMPPPFMPPPGMPMPPGLPRFPSLPPGFRLPPPGFIPKTIGDWTEHRLPDGRLYYHNNKSKESKWEKPLEFTESAEKNVEESNKTVEENKADTNSEKPEEVKESVKKEEDNSQKPIASKPVTGTGWHLVWTGDGKVFFFHPVTKTSIWERPKELEDNTSVDDILKKGPALLPDKEKSSIATDSEMNDISDNQRNKDDKKVEEHEPESKKIKLDSEKSIETTDSVALNADPVVKAISPEKTKDVKKEKQNQVIREAQVKKAIIPLEERMVMFTHLLREKEVSAFSTWEKELHKILFDPRYLLLTMKDRKACYDKYVKVRATEERKERIQKSKERKEDFKKLLEEVISSARVNFSDFAAKNAKDERYKSIEKMRDREALFNEYMTDFRKNERERLKIRDEKLRKNFYELLGELNNITAESEWRRVKSSIESDRRYELIGSSSKREQFFNDYLKEKFENSGSQSPNPADESGERIVEPSSPKETPDEEDVTIVNKNERIEASLRKREEEVRAQKEIYEKDREKERGLHLHEKAVQHFRALLSDMVKDTQFTWKETRRSLRKDPRWSALDVLDKSEKESLFNSHIEDIKDKRKKGFRKLLDKAEIPLDARWRDVRKQIKDDPRYAKYGTSELREDEFENYLREKLTAARTDFRELLRETKVITYKSKKLIDDTQSHLKDIKEILKKDKRYHVMASLSHERDRLLMTYIEELHKRGPPPPPTATNPAARYKKD